jgi:hypothetical protein
MTHQQYYNRTSNITRVSSLAPRASLAGAGIGLVVGSTGAIAKNIRRVKEGEITRQEAVSNTVSVGLGAGLATGAATAVVGAVGLTGLAGLLGVLTVATGVQYLWQGATQPVATKSVAPTKKR